MESMLVVIQGWNHSSFSRFMCIKSFWVPTQLLFIHFRILLHHLKRVDSSPSLFRQHSELIIADLSTSVFIHETVKLSNIIEGNFQTEEVNSLSELVEWDWLRVISIEISKSCPQILESFVELLRDKTKEFVEACLFSGIMLSCVSLMITNVLRFGYKAIRLVGRHNVSELTRRIFAFDFVYPDRVKVEGVDETR